MKKHWYPSNDKYWLCLLELVSMWFVNYSRIDSSCNGQNQKAVTYNVHSQTGVPAIMALL